MINTGVVPDANVGLNSGAWFKSSSFKLNGIAPTRIDDFVNERYYSSSGGVSSFPFSSVRTTHALQYNASGSLIWAPNRMLIRTALTGGTGGTVGAGAVAPTGWSFGGTDGSVTYSTSTVNPAVTAITFTAAVQRPYIQQNITVQENSYYVVRMKVEEVTSGSLTIASVLAFSGVAGTTQPQFRQNGNVVPGSTVFATGDDLEAYYLIGTTPGTMTLRWGVGVSGGSTGVVRLSMPQMERIVSLTDRASAFVQQGASAFFSQRIDYTPNAGAKRGFLVEAARTNDVTNGMTITGVNGGSTTTGASYLGGWVFRRYTADGTSVVHRASTGTITPSATQLRRVTVIAKAISGTRLQVATSTAHAPASTYVNVSLTTGAVLATGAGASNVLVEDLGNNIYRIGFDYTTIGVPAAGNGVDVFHITADGDTLAPTNTSSDVTDLLFFENCAGSGYHSPVPTFGTAATMGADTATTTNIGWLDQTKGTMYTSFIPGSDVSGVKRIAVVTDGTTNNAYGFTRTTSSNAQLYTILAGVTTTGPTSAGTSTNFATSKVAHVFNSPDRKTCLNGGAVATSSVAFPTSGITTLRMGNDPASSNQLAGWIREFRYYPDATASDPQLQTLTT